MLAKHIVSALEHEVIPLATDGGERSVTSAEAERLADIGEQRPGFCVIGRRTVKLAQFCGVVGLGERVLEILPKTESTSASVEDCRGVLMRLLRLTDRLPQFQDSSVGQHLQRLPLLDVFIAAFFQEVVRVIRSGLLKQYLEHDENLMVVRGRIAVSRQIAVLANRPDVLACAFDELTVDNVWNRVLKRAIRVTRPWIRNVETNRRWVELIGVLDEIQDALLTSADLARLRFDRKADRYRAAIEWARWILALLAPSLRAGQNAAPALLFDMNKLFEGAVANHLRRRASWLGGVQIQAQESSRWLTTVVGGGREDRSYVLRPDLIVRRSSQVVAVADTKWKSLEYDRYGRPVPNEADMYQMNAYAAAFRCSELALIYPSTGVDAGSSAEYRLPMAGGIRPTVHVFGIDVQADGLPLRLGNADTQVGRLLS